MNEKLVYLVLCVAAIVLAAHFPMQERRAALCMAIVILANWLLCEWTYSSYAPQLYLPVRASSIWAMADATVGVLALGFAREWRWGWLLWAISITQCGFHEVYQRNWLAFETYEWWLDKLQLASIAVFILGGGKGVGERVHNLLAGGGGSLRLRALATREARWRQ